MDWIINVLIDLAFSLKDVVTEKMIEFLYVWEYVNILQTLQSIHFLLRGKFQYSVRVDLFSNKDKLSVGAKQYGKKGTNWQLDKQTNILTHRQTITDRKTNIQEKDCKSAGYKKWAKNKDICSVLYKILYTKLHYQVIIKLLLRQKVRAV